MVSSVCELITEPLSHHCLNYSIYSAIVTKPNGNLPNKQPEGHNGKHRLQKNKLNEEPEERKLFHF